MSQDAQRIQKLEARLRKQQAEIDQLKQQLERVTNERDVARLELKEERLQHEITRQHLRELTEAICTLRETHKQLLRRHFAASSERAAGTQEFLKECMDQLDPDEAAALKETFATDERIQHKLQQLEQEQTEDSAATSSAPAVASDDTDDQGTPRKEAREKKRTRPQNSGGRQALPEDLPRQEAFYTPGDDHPYLFNAVMAKEIGRRIISRMAIEPLQVLVRDISCPVMRLGYKNGVKTQQTIAPPAIIHQGQVDDSVLVHSACDKILDYLPSYRQSNRFARCGITIHRSKLCRWHQALASFLNSITVAIFKEIVASAVVGIDDTIHRLLDAELQRCKNGRLWAVTSGKNSYYLFAETREGKWMADLLGDFSGGVMGDAYAGHNVLLERDQVTALFCWAHVRRKFFEAEDQRRREQALHLIGQLYDIERAIADDPPHDKVRQRTAKAAPILAQFKQLLDAWQEDPHVLSKSGIGRATTYALNQWEGLQAYRTIGEAPIDKNATERAMRPNALHRKNSLFSASVAGAEAYAGLSTVIHSAHNHGLNPYDYLTDIIDDLHYQRRPPEELTPAKYLDRVRQESAEDQPA